MLEPTVSSFSIKKAELCRHALDITWVREKLTPCFCEGRPHNDPKAQAGIDNATVLVPWELKCSALHWARNGCTQAVQPPPDELVHQHSTAQHSTATQRHQWAPYARHRHLSLLLLSPKPVLLSLGLANPNR